MPESNPFVAGVEDSAYPSRLRALASPPERITFEGNLAPPERGVAVAIVGTRSPATEAEAFAFDLAADLARAGVVVVSGGAVGVDAAAHRGALSVGGRTWAVAANGRARCFPKEHAALFREIAIGPGAVLWPFEVPALPGNFLRRNGVLVALSDAVVIVQAGAPSGSLNAASWGRKLGRPVWAIPGPPWDARFTGCRSAIDEGAFVFTSTARFMAALGLPARQAPLPFSPAPVTSGRNVMGRSPPPSIVRVGDDIGTALVAAATAEPQHVDKIAEKAGVCVSAALTRLLTLALENVLVEGPEGFYRRPN